MALVYLGIYGMKNTHSNAHALLKCKMVVDDLRHVAHEKLLTD